MSMKGVSPIPPKAEGTTGDQDGAMKQQKEKKEVLSKQAKRRLADRTSKAVLIAFH